MNGWTATPDFRNLNLNKNKTVEPIELFEKTVQEALAGQSVVARTWNPHKKHLIVTAKNDSHQYTLFLFCRWPLSGIIKHILIPPCNSDLFLVRAHGVVARREW